MLAVFVLIDALGWELVEDREFLSDLLPHRAELKTVFGFSSAAIPSILTGLLPREHGRWNLFLYRPETSPFRWTRPLGRLPHGWINHRFVRKAVSIISRRVRGGDGYFQIYGVPVELLPFFDLCEKEDIYQPGGLRPAQSIFDALEGDRVPYRTYSYHRYSDGQAIEQVVRDLKRGGATFYFVYLAELDGFLHTHVKSGDAVDRELDKYAGQLRRVCQAALDADPEAAVYVFSDHGMTPIRETFDLAAKVSELGWKVPGDYLALYDATMARFWFFRPGSRRSITAKLQGLTCGHSISFEERRRLGIDFEDNRFGDLVFLMRPGCLIHPSHMGRVPWPGMHGFHPEDPSSSAALLARREPPVRMRCVRDLYDLMRHEAGIRS